MNWKTMLFGKALLLCLFAAPLPAGAQSYQKNPDDFIRRYLSSTPAIAAPGDDAVVLYERSRVVVTDDNRSYRMENTVERVIKVLNKQGLRYADVVVTTDDEPGRHTTIGKVRGTVYNLVNGKMVKQELKSGTIFHDEPGPDLQRTKFSLPAAEVGSVIAYSFRIERPLSFHMAAWTFQGEIPRLWSELEVSAPHSFSTTHISEFAPVWTEISGNLAPVDSLLPVAFRHSTMDHGENWTTVTSSWVWRDVPALPDQQHISSLERYAANMDVQLTGVTDFQRSTAEAPNFLNTYEKLDQHLLESFRFYRPLERPGNRILDAAEEQTKGLGSQEEKARRLYHFVQNRVVSPETSYSIFSGNKPDEVLGSGMGSRSETNFLLIALLQSAGIEAQPVILGTRDHQAALADFPILDRFNLTICQAVLDGNPVYLDASQKGQAFGNPGLECLGGYARLISPKGCKGILLRPSEFLNRSVMMVKTLDADPAHYHIELSYALPVAVAAGLRRKWSADSLAARKFAQQLAETCPIPARLERSDILNLDDCDKSLVLRCEMSFSWPSGGEEPLPLCLFPMVRTNPFSAASRLLPVELDGRTDEEFILQLQLPAGTTLTDVPAAERIAFDGQSGFRYMPAYDAKRNLLRLSTRLQLNDSELPAEKYAELRTFYERVLQLNRKAAIIKTGN